MKKVVQPAAIVEVVEPSATIKAVQRAAAKAVQRAATKVVVHTKTTAQLSRTGIAWASATIFQSWVIVSKG